MADSVSDQKVEITFVVAIPDEHKITCSKFCVFGENCSELRLMSHISKSKETRVQACTINMKMIEKDELKVSEGKSDLKFYIGVGKDECKIEDMKKDCGHELSIRKVSPDLSMLQFRVHVTYGVKDVRVEPVLGYYLFPRETVFDYFHGILDPSLKSNDTNRDTKKDKFAQCLVPNIKIDGSYDGRCKSSKPQNLHNIWDNKEPNDDLSAIQHIQKKLATGNGPSQSREEIRSSLKTEYRRREKVIFDAVSQGNEGIFPYTWNNRLQRGGKNLSENEYTSVVTNLAEQVDISSNVEAKFLMSHAHAIIRGRLEAFSTTPHYDLLSEEFDKTFKSHVRPVGAWFLFLMRVFEKLLRLKLPKPKKFHDLVKSKDGDPQAPNRISLSVQVAVNSLLSVNSFQLHHVDKIPRENVMQYLYSRVYKLSPDLTFDHVKDAFAQRLVPHLKINGHYDRTCSANDLLLARSLYATDTEKPPKHSAVREVKNLLDKDDTGARQRVQQWLEDKYIERKKLRDKSTDWKERISLAGLVVRGIFEHLTIMEIEILGEDKESKGTEACATVKKEKYEDKGAAGGQQTEKAKELPGLKEWKDAIVEAGDWFEKLMDDALKYRDGDNKNLLQYPLESKGSEALALNDVFDEILLSTIE